MLKKSKNSLKKLAQLLNLSNLGLNDGNVKIVQTARKLNYAVTSKQMSILKIHIMKREIENSISLFYTIFSCYEQTSPLAVSSYSFG